MDIFKLLQIVVQRMDKSETISKNWIGLKCCFSSVNQVLTEEAGGLVIRISCFTNSIIHITPTCSTNNIFAAQKKQVSVFDIIKPFQLCWKMFHDKKNLKKEILPGVTKIIL